MQIITPSWDYKQFESREIYGIGNSEQKGAILPRNIIKILGDEAKEREERIIYREEADNSK